MSKLYYLYSESPCLFHSAEGMNAGGYGNLLMSIEQPQGEYSVTISFLNLITTLVRVSASGVVIMWSQLRKWNTAVPDILCAVCLWVISHWLALFMCCCFVLSLILSKNCSDLQENRNRKSMSPCSVLFSHLKTHGWSSYERFNGS